MIDVGWSGVEGCLIGTLGLRKGLGRSDDDGWGGVGPTGSRDLEPIIHVDIEVTGRLSNVVIQEVLKYLPTGKGSVRLYKDTPSPT